MSDFSQALSLLEGEEKALLLDTGYGIVHLRAFKAGKQNAVYRK